MDTFNSIISQINGLIWHDYVLYGVLITGLIFTVWSGFGQWRALTHGTRVVLGKYNQDGGSGALSHFQALSAALSATVGLGNIGGVAIAIALGGPGAVFWMWVVGFLGMALKMAEVTLTMLYRRTDDADNPHGGTMWVINDVLAEKGMATLGKLIGGLFCVTVLVFTFAGGNMFQAWNVGDITRSYFDVDPLISGIILAIIVGAVIIGGIKRIGSVAGTIVPIMCGIYLIAGGYVLVTNAAIIPDLFVMIFEGAFSGTQAQGAFVGGTLGYAFLWGMKRALFSSEAGLGSAPMAHAAAKTHEPVREGVVAGLEPFIDTIVVCTMTALVILASGLWNRPASAELTNTHAFINTAETTWQASDAVVSDEQLSVGDTVFSIIEADPNQDTGNNLKKLFGEIVNENGVTLIRWNTLTSNAPPKFRDLGVYHNYVGATATAKAFDSAEDGLGKWMVTIAVWLFAISTMISWSYYGEQGIIFLVGEGAVLPYRLIYCGLAIVACTGFIQTTAQLGNFSDLGSGLMLLVNIPITLLLGSYAMRSYRHYIDRLKLGEFD